MYSVLACLTTQHDYRLLALAILICVVESFAALYVFWQVSETGGRLNKIWVAVAGLCTGGAIWATHFIAMLAYDNGVATAYEPVITLVSLLVAFAVTTAGLAVAAAGWGLPGQAAGGAIIGVGTVAMHFIGMSAVIIAGEIDWDWRFVSAAVVLGILFSAGAMVVFHSGGRRMPSVLSATALLALSIASLHFIAMTAVTVIPDPSVYVPAKQFSTGTLASSIVAITCLVLGAAFIASFQEGRAARESAQSARELVDVATEALVLCCDGVIVDANRRAIELWGGEGSLPGCRIFGDLLVQQPQTSGGDIFTFETALKAADGTLIPVEILRQPLHALLRANEAYAISDLRPLIKTTDRLRRMNEELQSREGELSVQNVRFDTALAHMTQGLCMFDSEQRLVVCNRRYAELYGLTLEQLPPGTPLMDIMDMRIANGIYACESPDAYRQERIASVQRDSDMVQELNDGRFIAISLRLMPGGGFVSTHEDVTERRHMEDRLTHLAHHDPLTDLPNRLLLREKLEKTLKGSRRSDPFLAVLMLDLDRFKEVNDTLGHMVGDILLQRVAERLRGALREQATVARFGGDEFTVMEPLRPGDDPEALPRRIQELLSEPIDVDGHAVSVGTTIGIAIAPRDGTDPDELLKRADHALYRAKSEARGTYRFFQAEMAAALRERREIEQDLAQALPGGQLELYYQPLVNLAEDRIAGYESLLRWHHPVRGMVSPAAFIPVAEETGIITTMTEWILHEACAEAARWPGDMKVAVNLSVPQFRQRNLVSTVLAVLAKTDLPPQRLELEITESVMMNDAEGVFALFGQLRDIGVRLVLDDFGTGYSSLSYLLRFPFDKIKIDRSFVKDLASGGNSLVLVRSLIQMARGLGVTVTAEGIETKEQLEIVRAEGCTEIQGYYISQPRPAAEIRTRHLRSAAARKAAVA